MNDYLDNLNRKHQHQNIDQILAQAKAKQIPIISDDAMHLLLQLIRIAKVKRVLEIGTAIGYSAMMIAIHSDALVTTIERDEVLYQQACDNVKHAKLSDKIKLIQADAVTLDIDEDERFDLIFIDAAKAAYIALFEKYEPYLKQGGLIVSDNLLFHGMVSAPEKAESRNVRQLVRKIDQFNHFLIQHPGFDSYIYDIGDGMSISIKK